MIKAILGFLLTLVDFKINIGIRQDDVTIVIIYKDGVVFEKTLDLMSNGVTKTAKLLQNKSK